MAADIIIKFDQAKLRELEKLFADIPNALPQIVCRSINKTTTTARAEIARKIAARIKMKIGTIKKGIKRTKATYKVWKGKLNIYKNRIPLIRFGVAQTNTGVNYKGDFEASDYRERFKFKGSPIRGAFTAAMKSGHIGVFIRESRGYAGKGILKKGRRYKLPPQAFPKGARLPIYQLFGPSYRDVFEEGGLISSEIKASAHRTLEENIDSQVRLLLSKRMAG